MPKHPQEHNSEDEEIDPLDREDLDDEETPAEEDEIEEENIEESKEEDEKVSDEDSSEDQEEELAPSFRHSSSLNQDEEEVLVSSDEEPIDLDESDGDRDKGVSQFEAVHQPQFSQDFEEEKTPQKQDFKEHTLEDLAEEGEDLPTGVVPSKPKSFAMDEDMDFKQNIPHLGSHIQGTNIYANNRRSGRRRRLNGFLLLVIGILVVGGSVYLLKGKLLTGSSNLNYNAPVASSSSAPEPTPIPTPELDRSQFSVRVLNGTTKSGLAASVSSKLKGLGYQTDKTGNATNSAFQRTQVRVKEGDASLSAQLIKDLSPDFDATDSTPLKDSDAADAEIILGQR